MGIGEASLIQNLSPETPEQIELLLNEFIQDPDGFISSRNLEFSE